MRGTDIILEDREKAKTIIMLMAVDCIFQGVSIKNFPAASWHHPKKSRDLVQGAVKSVALIFYDLNIL